MEEWVESLNKKEMAYAMRLRDVKPPVEYKYAMEAWHTLVNMICDDYVRPSRYDRFKEVAERGQ